MKRFINDVINLNHYTKQYCIDSSTKDAVQNILDKEV